SQDSFGPPPRSVSDLRSEGAKHFLRDESFEAMILTFLYELCIEHYSSSAGFNTPLFQLLEKLIGDLTGGVFRFESIVRKDNARFEIRVLTEGNESKPLPLQKASQGTLSVLSMVGLTYRFLTVLHPTVRDADIVNQQAIVIIDEIDAHLHPAW